MRAEGGRTGSSRDLGPSEGLHRRREPPHGGDRPGEESEGNRLSIRQPDNTGGSLLFGLMAGLSI